MHLPIWAWRNTLARLGVKIKRGYKKPAERKPRSLSLEMLERRELLTSDPYIAGLSNDTGYSNSDGITNDPGIQIYGNQGCYLEYQYSYDSGSTWSDWLGNSTPSTDGSITVRVQSKDGDGNVLGVSDPFSYTLDRAGPTVTSVTPSPAVIGDSAATASQPAFSVTVEYSEAIYTTVAPEITFSPDLTAEPATLTPDGGNWSDSTHYVARFDVSDADLTASSVGISVGDGEDWKDLAGNALVVYSGGTVDVDTENPAAPTIVGLANDTGSSSTDKITTDPELTLSGVETGATREYRFSYDDGSTWSNWGANEPTASGPRTSVLVEARQIDVAGNAGPASDPFSYTLDAPAVTSVTPNLTMIADSTVAATQPAFTVTVTYNEAMNTSVSPTLAFSPDVTSQPWTTLTFASANWTNNDTTYVAKYTVNDSNLTVVVGIGITGGEDQAGNTQIAYSGTTDDFNIDTENPAAPSIVGLTIDTGSSTTDKITSDPTLTATGIETGATIQYSFDGGTTWSSTCAPGTDGTKSTQVRQIDAAGNLGPASDPFTFTLDTTSPSAPSAPDLQTASDSGSSHTDNITNVVAPTFDLTGASPYFRFYRGTTQISGNYESGSTFTTASQSDGTYNVSVSAVDAAGNESTRSTPLSVTIDTTGPVMSVIVGSTTISDADVGTAKFAVSARFNEQMSWTVPTISFTANVTGDGSPATLTLNTDADKTTWTSNGPGGASYRFYYNVADNDVYYPHVGIVMTAPAGLKDIAGNAVSNSPCSGTDDFSVNTLTTPAHVVRVSVPWQVTDSNVGADGFWVKVQYDTAMDESSTPTITFQAGSQTEDVNDTLQLDTQKSHWIDSTHYFAAYNVADTGVTVSSVDVAVAGAQDAAGYDQARYLTWERFALAMTATPTLPAVTAYPNLTTVTAANVGTDTFYVAIQFDETMSWGPGCEPTVILTGDTPEETAEVNQTLVYDWGTWTSSDQMHYAVFHTVGNTGVYIPHVNIEVLGGSDYSGHAPAPISLPDAFSINMQETPAHVVRVSVPWQVTDSNVGADGFWVKVQYDTAMDESSTPTITFQAGSQTEDVNDTLQLDTQKSHWIDSTHYFAAYNVADTGVTVSSVDVAVAGAQDAAGYDQARYLTWERFALAMTATPTLPAVTAYPNLTTVTAANVGTDTFYVAIQFDETMSWGPGCEPTVILTGDTPEETAEVNQTLVYDWGTWTSSDQMHYAVFHTVGNTGVYIPHVNIEVLGGSDYSGHAPAPISLPDAFSINMQETPAHVVRVSVPWQVTDSNVGADGFWVKVQYDTAMDESSTPTITFQAGSQTEDVNDTLQLDTQKSHWIDSTHYFAAYNVADTGVTVSSVDVAVAGAQDAAGYDQARYLTWERFALAMTATPTLPAVTAYPNLTTVTAANVGTDTFYVAIQFDETMSWGPGYDPVVRLTGDTAGETADVNAALSYHWGTWTNSNQKHYAVFFNVQTAGLGVYVPHVNIDVMGGSDYCGHAPAPISLPDAFTIDTQVPAAPGEALTADTGISATDKITSNPALTLTGVETDATVEYNVNTGGWSTTYSPVEGANSVQVRQTDAAGNVGPATTFTFTLDTQAPTAPGAPDLQAASDTGSSSTDNITNDATPTFDLSGASPYFRFYRGTTQISGSYASGSTYTTASQSDGTYDFSVSAVDAAGNESSKSTALSVTIDTTAAVPGIALANDTGSSATDEITSDGTLTQPTGVETNASAQYSVDGGANWTSSFTAVEGANAVQVRQTDVAGNVSAASSALSFILVDASQTSVILTWDPDGVTDGHFGCVTGQTDHWSLQNNALTWVDISTSTRYKWADAPAGAKARFVGEAGTVVIDSGVSAANVFFQSDGFTLSNGTLTLTGSGPTIAATASATIGSAVVVGANQQFSVAGAKTLSVTGAVSGSNGLTKTGVGVLTFAASNTYTGGTTISAGTLKLGNGTSNGSVGGDITDNAALVFANVSAQTYTGIVRGSGTLTKVGSGTLTLTGTNTYSGGTTISAGTLQVGDGYWSYSSFYSGSSGTLGSGAISVGASGTLLFARSGATPVTVGGVISGSGVVKQVGSDTVVLAANNPDFGGTILIGRGCTLQVGAGGTAGSLGAASVSDTSANSYASYGQLVFNRSDATTVANAISGSLSLVQQGSAALTLTGNNTYSGGTTINSGTTLQVGNSAAVGTGTVTDNGTLDLNGYSLTVGGLGDGGSGTRLVTSGAAGNIVLTVGGNNSSTTFSGTIQDGSGSVALMKVGTAMLTLTGDNAYSGGTTISAGTLQVGNWTSTGTLGTGGVVDNASLVFWRSGTATIANAISGSGTLTQYGDSYNGHYGTTVLTGNNTYTGATTIYAGSTLQVGAGGTTGTLGSGAVNYTTNYYNVTAHLVSNRSDATTVGDAISGNINVTQQGSGTLTLTGSNTYTGGTTISAGTLQVGNSSALGTGTATVNGTLDLNDYSPTLGGLSGSGTGLVTTGVTGDVTLTVDGNGGTFSGVIQDGSGSVALAKTGTGTLILAGANTYSGGTTISGSGVLQVGNYTSTGTLGTGAVVDNGSLVFWRSGTATIANAISGSGTVTQSSNSYFGQYSTLVLAGNNTYTGTTTICSGSTIQIGGGGATGTLGSGAVNYGNGTYNYTAHLVFNRSDATTVGNAISGSINVTQQGDGALALTGVISGAASLTQQGSGTLTLTGSNTYTGGTTISAGTLQVGNSSALGTGTATVNGTLDLNDYSPTLGGLSGSGTGLVTTGVTGDVTLTVDGNGGTFSGVIQDGSGSVALAKTGTGTLILAGANTYSGGTTISGSGVLQVGNYTSTGTLGTGAVVDNGSLVFWRSGTATIANAISGSGTVTQFADSYNGHYGTTVLTGNNTYTGTTTIYGGSTLQVGAGGTLGTGAVNYTTNYYNVAAHLVFNRGDAITVGNAISGNINVTQQGAGALTLTGVISSSASVTQQGAGTLTLTGGNTYTGGTTINTGTTLQVGNSSAFGTGTVTDNGTLDLNGCSPTLGGLSDNGSGTGLVTTGVTGAVTLTVDGNGGTFSGVIQDGSGSVALAKTGSGTLTVTGANTYSGGTTISGSGALQVGNYTSTGTLGTGAVVDNASLVFWRSGTATIANAISGSGTVTQFADSYNGHYGTTVLTGNNTYTGTTTIYGGSTLQVGAGGTLGTGAVNYTTNYYNVAAHLVFNRGDAITVGNAISGNINVTQQGAGALTLTGVISSSASVTQQGSGTLTLTGTNNTYSGGTTINAGATLAIGVDNPNVLGTDGVTINATGALDLHGHSITVGGLSGGGAVATGAAGASTLSVGNGNASSTFSGVIQDGSGTVALTKIGTGTLTLTGSNTYSGITTINAGTIQVGDGYWSYGSFYYGSSGALGSGAISVGASGTLLFARSGATPVAVGGVISGSGAVKQVGSDTVVLAANNPDFGGTLLIGRGCTLQVGAGGTAGSLGAASVSDSSANSYASYGQLVFNRNDATTVGNAISGSINVTQQGDGALALTGVISGAASLTQQGSGTLTLTGSNTYTGGTTIAQGTLVASNIVVSGGSSNLGNSTSAIVLGDSSHQGVLSYTGDAVTYTRGFTVSSGGGELDAVTAGQTLTIATGGINASGFLTLAGAGNITVSSVVSGSGGLTKTGSGTLALAGNNTYLGDTTVSAGTLKIGAVGALPSGWGKGNVTVNGTFDLNGNSITVNGLSGSGTVTSDVAGAGVTVGSNNQTSTFAGVLQNGSTGTLAITKSGTGTLTLSGVSTYTGNTTVSQGGLCVSGSIVASAVTVDNGAVLSGSGTVGAVTAGDSSGRGTISPGVGGVGTLSTGNLAFATAPSHNIYYVNLTDSGSDRLGVTGTVSLTNVDLDVSSSTRVNNDGVVLVLIDNDGTDAVTGTFSNLSEGAQVTAPLPNGVTYFITYSYDVQTAQLGSGNDVALIDILTAPSTLVATAASPAQINLTWTDNSNGEGGYAIERSPNGTNNWTGIGTAVANATGYSDTGLSEGALWYYRVRATGEYGNSSWSNTSSVRTPLATPTGLSATSGSSTCVTLSWQDNSGAESSYFVDRWTGSVWQQAWSGAANSTTATIAGTFVASTQYQFRVRAYSTTLNQYSLPCELIVTPVNLATPTGLMATAVTDERLDLTWTDNATGETGYKIERMTATMAWTEIAALGANATSYSDASLTEGSLRYYRVQATGFFDSPYSSLTYATTLPVAPTGLSLTSISGSHVSLTWDDNSSIETHYYVEQLVGSVWEQIGPQLGPGTTAATIPGSFAPSTQYSFFVRASALAYYAGDQYSLPSNVVTVTTAGWPAAPSGLTATVVSDTEIDLTWMDNASNETSFTIERSTNGTTWTQIGTANPSETNPVSFSDTTLTEGLLRSYRVRATNAAGNSAYTGVTTATTLPAAPTGLQVDSVSGSEMDLQWQDNSAIEDGYSIEQLIDGDWQEIQITDADATTQAIAGLFGPSIDYSFRVKASADSGYSLPSSVVTVTTAGWPAAPTDLTATAVSDTEIDLTWTDNATDETGYKIEHSADGSTWTLLDTLAPDTTTYNDTGLTEGTPHYYRVLATNIAGDSGYSSGGTTTLLAAPTGLQVTSVSGSEMDLQWVDNSAHEGGYSIEQLIGSTWQEIQTTDADATSQTITGTFAPATDYSFRVTAFSDSSYSQPSSIVTVTTVAWPTAPSGLTAVAASDTQIDLTWVDNATNELGYKIERSPDNSTWTLLTTTAANVTSYSNTGRTEGTLYFYRVCATNSAGDSGYSTSAATTLPATPTSLSATSPSGGVVSLSWEDHSSVESNYVVEQSTGGTWQQVMSLPANSTAATVTGPFAPSAEYSFRVRAHRGAGDQYSLSSNVETITMGAWPAAPSGLTATAVSDIEIDLTWTDNATNETGYKIERSLNGTTWTLLTTVGQNVTSYSNTGLTEGTLCFYRVRATNSAGDSGFSADSAITLPAAPTNLSATFLSGSEVSLSWQDHSDIESDYVVEQWTGSDFEQIASLPADSTTATIEGTFIPSHQYIFRVKAHRASDDQYSVASNVELVTTGTWPAAPTDLAATAASDTEIDLTWTDNATDETGYRVERSLDQTTWVLLTTTAANATSYSNAGLTEGTSYHYRVSATNSTGDSGYATSDATTLPTAPLGLQVDSVSGSEMDIQWQDNSAVEDGYSIEQLVGAAWQEVQTANADATSATVIGTFAPTTDYSFRARAHRESGDQYSLPSSVVTVTTAGWPAAPTDLAATAISDTEIDLTWTDNATNETGYRVERSPDEVVWTLLTTTAANATGYNNTGLTEGTSYHYRVRGTNSAGDSGVVAVAATTYLAAPTDLQVDPVSGSEMDLQWQDNSAIEDGYSIEQLIDGDWQEIQITDADATTQAIAGLFGPSIDYSFRVKASADSGYSLPSSVVTVTTAGWPAAPTDLTATAVSDTEIDLTWTDNATDETGYKIEHSADGSTWTLLDTLAPDTTTYNDTGLTEGTPHYYRVLATNIAGDSGYSSGGTTTLLAAPTGLQVTSVSGSEMDLQWVDNSAHEGGYSIEQLIGSTWQEIQTTDADATSQTITGTFAPATDYSFRVTAFSDSSYSQPSSIVTVTTVAWPTAPSGLTAVAASDTQIDLTWVDNATNELGYKIERSPDNSTWTLLTTTAANVTSYSNTGRTEGTLYFYRVCATNSAGDSGYSTSAATTLPATPTSLSATSPSGGVVSLSWEDHSSVESNYVVEQSTGGTWQQVMSLPANSTAATVTGPFAPSAEYSFRVRAHRGAGDQYSLSSNVETITMGAWPAAPSGLTATAVSDIEIDLTWTDNATNETGYKIERSLNGTTWTLLTTVGQNVTSYSNTGLTEGTLCFYRVRATNSAGDSGFSADSAITLPAAPTNLSATFLSGSEVSLSWQDHSDIESDYVVEQWTGSDFEQIASLPADSTTATIEGTFIPSHQYIFRVKAHRASDDQYSVASNVELVTTGTWPAAPTDLAATAASDTEIDLTWTDNATDETGYRVERSLDQTTWVLLTTTAANATSYSNAGLTEGTSYHYRVSATNSTGDSGYATSDATTLPTAPLGLQVDSVSGSEMDIQWQDNSAVEDGYSIEQLVGAAWQEVQTANADATSATVIGTFAPTTDYSFRARAHRESGDQYSLPSSVVTVTTAGWPAAPTDLAATAISDTEIDLTWTDNATNETGYRVERSPDEVVWTLLTTTAANATGYNNTGLTEGTSYHYRVRGTNSAGDSGVVAVAATTYLAAPTDLQVDPVSGSEMDLQWQDNSAAEDGYSIEQLIDSTWQEIQTADADATSATATATFAAAAQCSFRVRAHRESDDLYSLPSSVVTVTTAGWPEAPADLTATAASGTEIDLTWTDNATNETGYKIERSVDETTWTLLTTTAANATSYNNTGLTEGTLYFYRVCATNSAGDSGYSSSEDATLPTAPTGLQVTTVSGSEVDLQWNDNSANEWGYSIQQLIDSTWQEIQATDADVTSLAITGAFDPSTEYSFRVVAYSGSAESPSSAVAVTTTAWPAAPTNLAVTVVSGTQVHLSWTGSEDATQYQIEQQVDGAADWTIIATVNDPQTSFDATGLAADGSSYSFRVCAVNSAGASAYSNVPTATQTQNQAPVVWAAWADDGEVTTTSTTLNAVAADDGGEGDLTYSWSVVWAPTGGDAWFDNNDSSDAATTSVIFTAAGTYGFSVTVEDADGLSATSAPVWVSVEQTLTSIILSPDAAAVLYGTTRQFGAIGFDQFDNEMTDPPTFTWSVDSGVGTITNGLYHAPTSGNADATATISASADGVSQTADIVVKENHSGVYVGNDGTIYVQATDVHQVKVFSTSGVLVGTLPFDGPFPQGMTFRGPASIFLADGSYLDASQTTLVRRSAGGSVIQTYIPSPYQAPPWTGMALDPNGTTFWACDESCYVNEFDIDTGAELLQFRASNDLGGLGVLPVPVLLDLTVTDSANPNNHVTAITDEAIRSLFVAEGDGSAAHVDIEAMFDPLTFGEDGTGKDVHLTVTRSDGRIVYDDDFSGDNVLPDLPLPVTDTARDFTIMAWLDENQNGVYDEGEDSRTVEVIDPGLDVLSMNNDNGINTPGDSLFRKDAKTLVQAWMPRNTDNDAYEFVGGTNQPLQDWNHKGRNAYENDLLPIRLNGDLSDEYQLEVTGDLKLYTDAFREHPIPLTQDGKVWKSAWSTLGDLTEVHDLNDSYGPYEEHWFWVEATGAHEGAGSGTIELNWKDEAGIEKDGLDPVRINIFQFQGPQNVPGYAQYQYTVTGSGQGEWVRPWKGSITSQIPARTKWVDISWDAGGVVGEAVYQAHKGFTWGYDVNVVNVDVGAGTVTTPNNQKMEARLAITTIEGPTVDNRGTKFVDGQNRPVSRGVRFIEAGFVQQLYFAQQDVQRLRGGPNSPPDTVWERSTTSNAKLEGSKLLDAATWMPTKFDMNGRPTEWKEVRSTLPWINSQQAWGKGVTIFRGTDDTTSYPNDKTVGHPARDAAANPFALETSDQPQWWFDKYTLGVQNLKGNRYPVHADWKFTLSLAVRTTEDVKGPVGLYKFGSANIYTQRAYATWEYKVTGWINEPKPRCTAGDYGQAATSNFKVVRGPSDGNEGVQIPPRSQPDNIQPNQIQPVMLKFNDSWKSSPAVPNGWRVVNDLFGPWR